MICGMLWILGCRIGEDLESRKLQQPLCVRNRARQAERKCRAAPQLADNVEVSAHCAREIAAYCEAEACSFVCCRLSAVELNERLEHNIELVPGNSGAGVGDVDHHRCCSAFNRDCDCSARLSELHRVGKKVEQNLLDFFRITVTDAFLHRRHEAIRQLPLAHLRPPELLYLSSH